MKEAERFRPQPDELGAAPKCLKAAIIARGFLASVVP